ncbi:FAD-dependent oxidoreductase [Desulfospira joergensenii]|uniref:FAD-dependent oxidoreductase n=1 Tax=Desulfospira joergensenii TaxID=53329 RepID=UPI0003B2ED7E|nr:FAD-dependent oxidoreductase [Desulfospira joergensenii]
MKKGSGKKILLLTIILVLAGLFFLFDLDRYVSFSNLKNEIDGFQAIYQQHRFLFIATYFTAYVLMAALSLPGAAIMSLAGAAVFGLVPGTIIISFASTMGAFLAFLSSRYLFRDFVEQKFSSKLETINRGMEKEGGFYLFTLRLVPLFPFFLINLAMGLTNIRGHVFYLVSQIGMLPGTIVYVNAGTQLAQLDSIQGILSFKILFAFALLGIFPIVAKRIIDGIRSKKIYARFSRPSSFDYNLTVIGGGSAGLVASYIGAAVKARVALIEEHKMGGDCLNTGCVPSKALIASAGLAAKARQAKKYGFDRIDMDFQFSKIMDRVKSVIQKVEPHDSVERYTRLGVDCFQGRAKILSPFEVKVGDKTLTTRNILIATGARPMVPELPGLESIEYLTSDTVWDLSTLPRRLAVLGGGPIGCELAQAFARLGSEVFLVQRGPALLKREDPDAAEIIQKTFETEGIQVMTGHAAREIRTRGGETILICDHGDQEVPIPFDRLLIALGRTPNVAGFGLEELGVELGSNRGVAADEFLRTNFPNIFCSGDVHGRYQFTHTAAHESWYASVNALFGRFKKFRVDYSTIPWATFTDPEVARAGLNETQAQEQNIEYEVVKYPIDDLDRAIADSRDQGFVKVLTPPGKDRILGVTIVGHHASDIIAEFVLAMKQKIGLNKILGTIHIYPTMAEANKYAAGMWKKAHAPERLLAWIKKYHAWMRK